MSETGRLAALGARLLGVWRDRRPRRGVPVSGIQRVRRWLGLCPYTGRRRCPWHPDGGNHPDVAPR